MLLIISLKWLINRYFKSTNKNAEFKSCDFNYNLIIIGKKWYRFIL